MDTQIEETKTGLVIPASQAEVVSTQVAQKHMVVAARNPKEMMSAQASLVSWATREVADNKAELAELKENLKIAKKSKWRTSTLQNSVNRSVRRIRFFEKIEAALLAGYTIVPNIEADVIAIRTTYDEPDGNEVTNSWAMPNDQASNIPDLGEGRYVDAIAKVAQSKETVTGTDGIPTVKVTRWADEFKEFQFPFAIAKPEILTATAEAMALKIFDDIVISPSRRSKKGDPMVIGRILIKKSTYNIQPVSFLISWFVDTRDIG